MAEEHEVRAQGIRGRIVAPVDRDPPVVAVATRAAGLAVELQETQSYE